ncbi:MAG: Gfo/Idh/MocA family oxidoreductase, partial [bacterium]|nr:Gfo/Idh/MocA family oxidoreductase [bacterium]
MRDGKLGVAVHGAGWVAGAHVASWLKNPDVAVVSISDIKRDRARDMAERHGLDCAVRDDYGEVLSDTAVDIIDVTGPNHVHTEHGIAAAEA